MADIEKVGEASSSNTDRDIVFTGKDGERVAEIKPTDTKGVYEILNPILTRRFIDMSEVYADKGIEPTPIEQA